MYRRLARINAGSSLSAQKDWLETEFVGKANAEREHDARVTITSYEGSSSTAIFAGATAAEHAEALDDALRQIEEELASDNGIAASSPGMLTPRFDSCSIPR